MNDTSILIVEDEGIVAEDLACKIRQLGYDVAGTTGTGEEAIELARLVQPDLVLMDIRLAGAMDGIEAAQHILKERNLPILYLTAHSDTTTAERAQRADASGYILKPFDDRDLRIQIEMALHKYRAEKQLRESEARYRLLAETMLQGIVHQDATGKIIAMNPAAQKILGKTDTDFLGSNSVAEEHHTIRENGEVFPGIEHPSMVALQTGLEVRDVVMGVFNPKLKQYRWISTEAVPVFFNKKSAPTEVYTVFEDITQRKQDEAEREAMIECLRFINESATTKDLIHAATTFFKMLSGCEAVGIRLKKGDDYPFYEALGFSDAFFAAGNRICAHDINGAREYNKDCNPMSDCLCGDVLAADSAQAGARFTAMGSFWCNSAGELLSSMPNMENAEHSRRCCIREGFESMALIPFGLGEKRLGLLQLNDRHQGRFTLQRISLWERLANHLAVALAKFQAEEALITLNAELELKVQQRTLELQEMQQLYLHSEKLAAIGKLSASIAHEFNNPMQGILSILNGVKKRATMEVEDTELVDIAIDEGKRISKLIRSLQDFNRPSSGVVAVMDVHQSLDSIILLHKNDFVNKRIEVTTDYAPDLPSIAAVADQIKQVFFNLLTNAADACQNRGGSITISTERENNKVAIAIKDSGIGIAPAELDNIFRPFYTTKPEVKGIGLGLSISYGIVKKHKGEIRIASTPGKGATFTVVLPIKSDQSECFITPGSSSR